ncbi:MAG: ester cyclase [Roseivirga sp.]|nr:ester cyclase [Roseivirga sp.]
METNRLNTVLIKARVISIVLTGMLFIQPVANNKQSVNKISQQYLNYYRNGQVNKLVRFWADSVVFEDKTAQISGEALLIKGRDNVERELTELFASVEDLSFTPEFGFSSGNFTISAGAISYQMPVSANAKTKVTFDVVTILEFKAGKVVKHADYADYQSLIKQLNK